MLPSRLKVNHHWKHVCITTSWVLRKPWLGEWKLHIKCPCASQWPQVPSFRKILMVPVLWKQLEESKRKGIRRKGTVGMERGRPCFSLSGFQLWSSHDFPTTCFLTLQLVLLLTGSPCNRYILVSQLFLWTALKLATFSLFSVKTICVHFQWLSCTLGNPSLPASPAQVWLDNKMLNSSHLCRQYNCASHYSA